MPGKEGMPGVTGAASTRYLMSATRSPPSPRNVGADVGDAPPVVGVRGGEGYANVLDWVAWQVDGGELAGSLFVGPDGIPVRPVGAGLHGVAARVVAGGGAGVEDDLTGRDGSAEVDLQVLARALPLAA